MDQVTSLREDEIADIIETAIDEGMQDEGWASRPIAERVISALKFNGISLLAHSPKTEAPNADFAVVDFAKARAWHHFGITWDKLEQISRDELIADTAKMLSSPVPKTEAPAEGDRLAALDDQVNAIINRNAEYMNGLDGGQRFFRTEAVIAMVKEALATPQQGQEVDYNDAVKMLHDTFVHWIELGPDKQPRHPNGLRPWSTGDLKWMIEQLSQLLPSTPTAAGESQ